ncbi:MAG: HEAT repeat domain-containing protein [Candidatus Thiodiazotropha sp.]
MQILAVGESTGQNASSFTATLMTALLLAVPVSAIVIFSLVHWGRKQDQKGEMMLFCMKYLLQSENEPKRCSSARALGEANDPDALLVLVDVIYDEEETEAVRSAAGEALHEMSTRFRKYQDLISSFELEMERNNLPGIIDILIANFEQGQKRYVQSAYIIGRNYMRLERFEDARKWLAKAELRNRKSNLYGNRIKHWIDKCNSKLIEEADASYKDADYYQAKEQYALLDHGLGELDKQRWAIYLRSACVYCMLKEYEIAHQSLLQALEHNHETDLALILIPLLQDMQSVHQEADPAEHKFQELTYTIDSRVNHIMSTLIH